MIGAYGSTVGIVSFSAAGRHLCKLLNILEVNILVYDPYVDEQTLRDYHASPASLEDIFCQSDVVTLHAPLLDETRGMITAKHFEMMKKDAAFINTARGAIVMENEMIDVLRRRQDIYAILDVTELEPP